MERERYQRLMALFDELCDVPEVELAARLALLRAEDAELAASLASMLAADRVVVPPLDDPAGVTRDLLAPDARAARAQAAAERVPKQVAHHRIVRLLGEGGMGQVYAAVDERLGRQVAIKLLPAGAEWSTESRLRMAREAQAASALNHPGIVTLHDVGVHDGRLFLVMELVDGESFHALAERGVPAAEALRLVAEAADALAAAHVAGVLHRDVKSENLMRTRDGRVKVLDFGLAKLRDGGPGGTPAALRELASSPRLDSAAPGERPVASSLVTRESTVMGTPSYMAPELLEGAAPTARGDVFALGVVLYELLTGVRPFARDDLPGTLAAIRECRPAPPSRCAPQRAIDAAIDAVALRALARDPAQRFPDMAAFAAAIRALHARPRGRRVAGIAAGIALLVAGMAAIVPATRREPPPGPRLLGPARRVTFDPGCEESPSWTPDGKALVFSVLVDGDYELTAMELASGARRRLTRQAGWDYGGQVSPDGSLVAYVHQGETSNVRVVRTDGAGEPRVVGAADGYPAWTADGRVLLSDEQTIAAWDPATGVARPIASAPPGRRAIYFAPFRDGAVEVMLGTRDQEVAPRLMMLAGEETRRVAIDDAAEYPMAASPSGTALYYQRNAAAVVELARRPRGGGAAAVTGGGVSATGGFAFAPDGGRLAYSTCRSTSYLARIRDGQVTPLTRAGGWTDSHPVEVAPRRLVFVSDRARGAQLWRLDLDGGAAVPLTPPGTMRPAVSVDHRRLAWAALDPPGIMVADLAADGTLGVPRRLTDRRCDTAPQLTHDGRAVIFVRLDDAGGDRVHVVPVDGGAARPLTPAHAAVASVSPVADELVYLVVDGGRARVLATDLAGRAPRELATLPGAIFRSLRHSPDGRRLLVVREDQEIVELDRAATPPAVRTLWRGSVESISAAEYASDGSVLASVSVWDGDVWMVDGRF